MAVFGSQSTVQREWLSKAKATVVDLVVLAATGTLDYVLGWMCEYLFHGNAQNCFAKYRDVGDSSDDDQGRGSDKKDQERKPEDHTRMHPRSRNQASGGDGSVQDIQGADGHDFDVKTKPAT